MSPQEEWDFEEFIQHSKAADDFLKEMQLRAKRTNFPSDPKGWLSDLQELLSKKQPELCEDLVLLMRDQIRHSYKAIQRNDTEDLNLIILTLSENLKILKAHVRAGIEADRKKGSSKGGRHAKKRQWAEEAAKRSLRENPKSQLDAWRQLPKSTSPWEFEIDSILFSVYVDGEQLIAVDEDLSKESTIKKSTFFSEYYRPAKKKGK